MVKTNSLSDLLTTAVASGNAVKPAAVRKLEAHDLLNDLAYIFITELGPCSIFITFECKEAY